MSIAERQSQELKKLKTEAVRGSNKRVGNYLLKDQLGEGGQATVFLCLNIKDDFKPYAIKQFAKDKGISEERHLDIVRTETQLMQNINHINILKAYEILETEKSYYIILEYCKKKSLESFIKSHPLPEPRAVFFLQQIMSGLQELKRHKILHRDIKLGNLLVNEDLVVKIADFGFSSMGEFGTKYVGTISHMAPEIIFKGNEKENIYYDYKADLWSTGIVFYELLHRRRPFGGNTKEEIQENIKKLAGTKLPFAESVSAEARDLLTGLLTIDPEKRYGWEEFFKHKLFEKYEYLRIDSDLKQSVKANFQNLTASVNYNLVTDYYGINEVLKIRNLQKTSLKKTDESDQTNSPNETEEEGKSLLLIDILREVNHIYIHEHNKINFLLLTVQKMFYFIEKFSFRSVFFSFANIVQLILRLARMLADKIVSSLESRENSLEINPEVFQMLIKEEHTNKNKLISKRFYKIREKFLKLSDLIKSYLKVIDQFARDKNICLIYHNSSSGTSLNELQLLQFIKKETHEVFYYKDKKVMKNNQEMFRTFQKVHVLIGSVLNLNTKFPYFVNYASLKKFDWKNFRKEIEILDLKVAESQIKIEKTFKSTGLFESSSTNDGMIRFSIYS